MSKWLDRLASDPTDLTPVAEAYEHYVAEYERFRAELDERNLRGSKITHVAGRIPGLSEYVYAQWSQIKAIVELMELRVQQATQKARKYYTEGYPKQLNAYQIENWAKSDNEVLTLTELVIQMKLVQDQWEGISKGVERLHHQLRCIVDLRKVGLEDATI